jgi:hypothetical protein
MTTYQSSYISVLFLIVPWAEFILPSKLRTAVDKLTLQQELFVLPNVNYKSIILYRVEIITQACFLNILICVRFEIFIAVTMKNAVFWDIMPCGSCRNGRSSETSVLTRTTQHNISENGILHFNLCLWLFYYLK